MKRFCLTTYEAREYRPVRATEVFQKCLGESLHATRALRSRVLLSAVEDIVAGQPLTSIDLARVRHGAQRISNAAGGLDRLLSINWARQHEKGGRNLGESAWPDSLTNATAFSNYPGEYPQHGDGPKERVR